eukprot:COSAG05_NODE_288_length_12074_cov_119.196827_7_plen_550_part_00
MAYDDGAAACCSAAAGWLTLFAAAAGRGLRRVHIIAAVSLVACAVVSTRGRYSITTPRPRCHDAGSRAGAGMASPPKLPPSPSGIPTYSGYTFWSSDFHIAPIADIKDLFAPFGNHVIDKSLSGACALKEPPTCQTDLRVLTQTNGLYLMEVDWLGKPTFQSCPGGRYPCPYGGCPNALKRAFFNSYKDDPEMQAVDAYLCQHAIGECEIFMGFGRPLVAIASTRYEIGRCNSKESWLAWNDNLRAIAADRRNIVAANNRYDAEYIKYFTGLKDVPVIPNLCGYTGVRYNTNGNCSQPEILIGPGRGTNDLLVKQLQTYALESRRESAPTFKTIRELYPHFEYEDLITHPAIVLMPYQVSLMSIFEYYRMCIPLYAPSPRLLAEWQIKLHVMKEITWEGVQHLDSWPGSSMIPQYGHAYAHDPNNQQDAEAISYWVKFADFYQWPHIQTFDNWEELLVKLATDDLQATSTNMEQENARMVVELQETWQRIFHKMFEGVSPAANAEDGGRKFEETWDAGMKKHYQVTAGECGINDDVHEGDTSHVTIEAE